MTKLTDRRGRHWWPWRARSRLSALGALLGSALLAPLMRSALPQPTLRHTRVLIVYAHDLNAPGVVRFSTPLKTLLRDQVTGGVEIYEESLDLNRFPNPSRRPQLVRYVREKYQGLKPDVIVAEGALAVQFVVNELAGLFPDIPVVYGAAFEPVLDFSSLPKHVVGRQQPLPFAATYMLAHALQPDAERVVLVGGASWTDSLLIDEARRQILPLLNGTQLTVYQHWSYAGLIDSLRRLTPQTFVLLSSVSTDLPGQKFTAAELVPSLTRAASVPVYGIARNWVGDGVIGGNVMDFSEDGIRTGRIVLSVLARRPNQPMPASEIAPTPAVVDWRELQRWKLSPERLPRNAEILFRPAPVWAQHRAAIVAIAGVVAVESALIGLLLLERRRRARAQRTAEEASAQVEHMARVATVNELATAVSHQLRQPLTAIRVNASAGAMLLAQSPPNLDEARAALAAIEKDDARAAEIIEHYRALLRRHAPSPARVDINAVCRDTAKLVEHEVAARHARLVLKLDPNMSPVLGDRVGLQQAVINLTLNALDAMSESADREAAITTLMNTREVELRVSDTGPGLAPAVQRRLFEPFFSTKPHGLGMGLTTVRTIVERHHGALRAENGSTGGAVFTVTLPASNESAQSLPHGV